MSNPNFAALGLQNAPEVIDPVQLPIQGTLPSWLSGALYRTGPGTFRIKTDNNKKGYYDVHHWFDGLGMHHKFEIREDGTQVWYNCRKSSGSLEKRIAEEGKNPFLTFNQPLDPCDSLFNKFFTTFKALAGFGPKAMDQPDAYNVSVTLSPNLSTLKPSSHTNVKNRQGISHIVAKTDSNNLQVINPDTLEPLVQGRYGDLDPRLQGEISAAHGCTDKRTGDFCNFMLKLGSRPSYTVFCVRGGLVDEKEKGRVDVLATITDAPAAYIHSSFMTERYVILAVWQADFTNRGLDIVWKFNMADAIDKNWRKDRPTLYYVIDRKQGGVVAKYESDPYFSFHVINSYEEGDDLVLDVSIFADNSVIWDFVLQELRDIAKYNREGPEIGTARRYRLRNISASSPDIIRQAEMVFDVPMSKCIELPTVHPNTYHKRYRYTYGISKASRASIISDRLIKLDMEHPKISSENLSDGAAVWAETDCVPGEPIFVPDPNGKEEDDGVLISVVLDGKLGKSMLVVLDAKNMEEVGRAVMDHPFPFGFHGAFVRTIQ